MEVKVGFYLTMLIRLLIAYLLFVVTKTVYDVYFGPLSKIPGPKLAAATRALLSYHKITGNGEKWLAGLHTKYGDVIRPAPTDVSFSNGKVLKEVYGYAPGSRLAIMKKDPLYFRAIPPTVSLVVASDEDHPRQRKVVSHAFSDKALLQQEPIIQDYIGQLISTLRKVAEEPGKKVDLVRNYNYTTFDIMADLTFGEPLGYLRNPDDTPWMEMLLSSNRVITVAGEMNHVPIIRKSIKRLIPKSWEEKRKAHHQNAFERVDKRLANPNPRSDIWSFIINAKEEQKLSQGEMYANAGLFMVAGTETTATTLSGVTYYLLTNPEKLTTLTKEIRTSFASSDEIRVAALHRLPYLHACIEEGLRIYPPIPMGLPRVVGKGGTELSGYFVPENTTVYAHSYSTYHNPNIFARPDEFVPERWLKDTPAEFVNDNRSACQPFSLGPRNCIGMNLAWIELRLVLANVLFNFDLTLCEESQNWNNQKTYSLWEKGPLMVTLKPVNGEA